MHAIGTYNKVKDVRKISVFFWVCQNNHIYKSSHIVLSTSTKGIIHGKAAWR